MPHLPKIKWKPGRKEQSPVSPDQRYSVPSRGIFSPSTSTFNSNQTNSSWNSQISLPSTGSSQHAGLSYIPENADAIRAPIELDGARTHGPWSPNSGQRASTPPPQYQPARQSQYEGWQNFSQPQVYNSYVEQTQHTNPRAQQTQHTSPVTHQPPRANHSVPMTAAARPVSMTTSPANMSAAAPRVSPPTSPAMAPTAASTAAQAAPIQPRRRAPRDSDMTDKRQDDLERKRNASSENVRRLRDLIRQKYALDLYVWSKRKVARANRKKIIPKCEEADRILQEIYFIVNAWEEDLFEPEEWRMVQQIKTALLSKHLEDGQSNEPAYWDNLKPWERKDDTVRA